MIKKIAISTPVAQARDIATILRAAAAIPHTTIDIGLGFDSITQAGQFQRRIREALIEANLDPRAFSFQRPNDSAALQLSYVGTDEEHPLPDEEIEESPQIDTPLPAQPIPAGGNGEAAARSATETPAAQSFSEGKAALQSLTTVERPGGSYVLATMIITEGHDKGQSFNESIRRFPPQPRLQRFADAFGVPPDDLLSKPSLLGTQVWFRRRNVTQPDGTPRTETFYYRISPTTSAQLGASR